MICRILHTQNKDNEEVPVTLNAQGAKHNKAQ